MYLQKNNAFDISIILLVMKSEVMCIYCNVHQDWNWNSSADLFDLLTQIHSYHITWSVYAYIKRFNFGVTLASLALAMVLWCSIRY